MNTYRVNVTVEVRAPSGVKAREAVWQDLDYMCEVSNDDEHIKNYEVLSATRIETVKRAES